MNEACMKVKPGCVVYFGRTRQCRPIWQCALYGLGSPGGWGCDARRAGQVWVGFGWVARGGPTGDTSARGGTAAVVPRARVRVRVRGWLSGCMRAWCLACSLSAVALRCDARQPPVSAKRAPPSVRKEGGCAMVCARGPYVVEYSELAPRAKVLLI